jgi:hypothetical protein
MSEKYRHNGHGTKNVWMMVDGEQVMRCGLLAALGQIKENSSGVLSLKSKLG